MPGYWPPSLDVENLGLLFSPTSQSHAAPVYRIGTEETEH